MEPQACRSLCGILIACLCIGHLPQARADSPNEIEKKARGALSRLYRHNRLAAENVENAIAILVFPEAKKLALGAGLETATGVLFRNQKPISFHNLTALSCGLEFGIQKFGHALFFMDEGALDHLYNSRGLDIGTTSSLVVADGIFADSCSTTANTPGILVFTFNQTGLMLDIGLQIAKITEYEPGD
ncbi:MAG: twin-arginine translocation pathway signal protein [bacterium]